MFVILFKFVKLNQTGVSENDGWNIEVRNMTRLISFATPVNLSIAVILICTKKLSALSIKYFF